MLIKVARAHAHSNCTFQLWYCVFIIKEYSFVVQFGFCLSFHFDVTNNVTFLAQSKQDHLIHDCNLHQFNWITSSTTAKSNHSIQLDHRFLITHQLNSNCCCASISFIQIQSIQSGCINWGHKLKVDNRYLDVTAWLQRSYHQVYIQIQVLFEAPSPQQPHPFHWW